MLVKVSLEVGTFLVWGVNSGFVNTLGLHHVPGIVMGRKKITIISCYYAQRKIEQLRGGGVRRKGSPVHFPTSSHVRSKRYIVICQVSSWEKAGREAQPTKHSLLHLAKEDWLTWVQELQCKYLFEMQCISWWWSFKFRHSWMKPNAMYYQSSSLLQKYWRSWYCLSQMHQSWVS